MLFENKIKKQNELEFVNYLSAPVGSGKTEAIIRQIKNNPDQNYIYVVPTIHLGSEIRDRVKKKIQHLDGKIKVDLIVSNEDTTNLEHVHERVLSSIYTRQRNIGHLVIITAATFCKILPTLNMGAKANYHLFIDEGIDPIDYATFTPERMRDFLDPINLTQEGRLLIKHGHQELLEIIADKPKELAAMGMENYNNPSFQKIAALLVSNIFEVYYLFERKTIKVLALLSPKNFLTFKSVTMIMANFKKSMLALLWERKFGIKFKPFSTQHDLFNTHDEKGPLIRIYHVLHPDDTASAMNLKRHWITGEHNASWRGDERVIDQVAIAVERQFKNRPYCWSANNFFKNHGKTLSGERMPTKSAGMDNFKSHNIVVSLECINPQPWVANMLRKHLKLEDSELYVRWKLSYTYQTIGRCCIRDRSSTNKIDVVVLSRKCAEQIQSLFKGSEIVGQLTDLPSYKAMNKKRGKGKGRRYLNKENARWCRHLKNNPDETRSKEEFFGYVNA